MAQAWDFLAKGDTDSVSPFLLKARQGEAATALIGVV